MATNNFNPYDWLPSPAATITQSVDGQEPENETQPWSGETTVARPGATANGNLHDVEVIVRRVESYKLDLTLNYQDWLTIGFALAELGESGRSYFHRLSRFYPGYNSTDTDRQFDHCLKGRRSGVTIKTFFFLAQQAGINIRV